MKPRSNFQKSLLLIAGLPLIFCMVVTWTASRKLQDTRGELQTVTRANEFLKKTLGEMTLAMTAKEKEIDRLQHTGCQEQKKTRPSGPAGKGRGNVPEPGRSKVL